MVRLRSIKKDIFHRGKISISQFLTQVKPGSISALFVNKIYYFRKQSVARITKVHRGILRGSPVIIIVYGLHHRISWCQNFSALKRVSIQRRTQREIYQAERDQLGSTRSPIREFLDFTKRKISCRVIIIIPRPPDCPLTSTNTVRAYKGLISPFIRLYRILYCHASRPTDSFQPARFSDPTNQKPRKIYTIIGTLQPTHTSAHLSLNNKTGPIEVIKENPSNQN